MASADDLVVIGHKVTIAKITYKNVIEKSMDKGEEEKPLEKDVTEKTTDKVEEVSNVGASPFDQYKGHPQVQGNVQAAQDEKEEQLKKKQ